MKAAFLYGAVGDAAGEIFWEEKMEHTKFKISEQEEAREKVILPAKERITHQLKEAEYNDLCTTCNSAPKCTVRKNLQRPIYFCDEYDDYVPPKSSKIVQSSATSKTGERTVELDKGLCVSCKHHDSCTLRMSKGRIWFCEEYE